MSQRELSRRSGLSQQWIANLESGQRGGRLKYSQAIDLADALGLAPGSAYRADWLGAVGRLAARGQEVDEIRTLFKVDAEFRAVVRALLQAWPRPTVVAGGAGRSPVGGADSAPRLAEEW